MMNCTLRTFNAARKNQANTLTDVYNKMVSGQIQRTSGVGAVSVRDILYTLGRYPEFYTDLNVLFNGPLEKVPAKKLVGDVTMEALEADINAIVDKLFGSLSFNPSAEHRKVVAQKVSAAVAREIETKLINRAIAAGKAGKGGDGSGSGDRTN